MWGLRWLVLVLLLMPLLSSCQVARGITRRAAIQPVAANGAYTGKLLIWHARTGQDAAVLESILREFEGLHPGLELLIVRVDANAMPQRFMTAAYSGLGPDLFIGPNSWIDELADNRMILSMNQVVERSVQADEGGESSQAMADRMLNRYSTSALRTVTYNEQIYGVPESLDTEALYYNRQMVETPPQSLDDLLLQVADGKPAAISTAFSDGFWGVAAFGGRLLDDAGRVMLNEGGFANWLNWLDNARDIPGTLLDANRLDLQERFRRGEVAFYVGYASEYDDIVQLPKMNTADAQDADTDQAFGKLREEDVGVALLPSGPAGNAAPLLTSEAFYFNAAATDSQLRMALATVDFVTNAENSTRFMRDAYRVPANVNVRVNPRLDPNMFSFTSQSRLAVAFPLVSTQTDWQLEGTNIYRQVLEGVLSPAQAADQLTETLNGVSGFAVTNAPPSECTDVGVVTLWEAAGEELDAAFDSTLRAFAAVCPTIIVQRKTVSAEELRTAWVDAQAGEASRVDLFLVPHAWLRELTNASALVDITMLVGVEVLQRYSPAALNAMRIDGRLYGLPYSMDVPALFYNREMIDVPAKTLDDLLNFSDTATQVAIPLDFERAYWGGAAFGNLPHEDATQATPAATPAASSSPFVIDVGAFLQWLTWLRNAQANAGVWLTLDPVEAQSRFIRGDAAYYVGVASDLHKLEDIMGADAVAVVDVPTGDESRVEVLLEAEGFVFNAAADATQTNLALQFALFATSTVGQSTLLQHTHRVPANVTVAVDPGDPVDAFVDQAAHADVAPSAELADAMEAAVNDAFELLLSNDMSPRRIVQQVVQEMMSNVGQSIPLEEFATKKTARLDALGVILINLDAIAPDEEMAVDGVDDAE